MKSFHYIQNDNIPKLAWCAIMTHPQSATVIHGHQIETRSQGFIEGAWDGDFDEFNFDTADFLMGSGGKINDQNQFIFSTPSHILERLYSIRTKDTLYIANSLPLIIALSNSHLLTDYLDYEKDLCSIVHGLVDYTKQIPLADARYLQLHYYSNLVINHLDIDEVDKPAMHPFSSFDHYEGSLTRSLEQITDNAQSPHRSYHYGLVTTISSGYDSAAGAALARKLGCTTAVTFNAPERHAKDSGKAIAQKLGYTSIIEKNAHEFLENSHLLEAEFVSTGELGSSVVFTSFEEEFADNIVFVGEGGDFIWDKNANSQDNFVFIGETYSQTSYVNNRLRVGYIILPVPFYGGIQWHSIKEISNAKNMAKYSVGGSYDRPIARKILEDAGVPRKLFGYKDIGAGINYRFDNFTRLKQRMSKKSFAAYMDYYAEHKQYDVKFFGRLARFLWGMRTIYFNYLFKKLNLSKRYEETSEVIPNPGAPSHLIHWGIATSVQKMKQALD